MSYEAGRSQLISEFEAEAAAIRKAFGVKGTGSKTSQTSKTDKAETPSTKDEGSKDAPKPSAKS